MIYIGITEWTIPVIEILKSAGFHLIPCYKEAFANLGPETKEKRGKKNEDKVDQIDKTSESVINRMVGVNNNRTSKVKRKDELIDLETLLTQRQDRLFQALEERYQYSTSIKRGQEYLLNYVSSKRPLVIMYADLVGSTKMSMTLPADKLVTIIRAFVHEMSSVVETYDGYVLKYLGDAVIAFFPPGFNKYLTYDKAVRCGKSMINVLKNGINPILKNYDCPELDVKIGIEEGQNVIVQYAYDKSSQIDLLGYTMNVSAKITSLTGPNKVSVGEHVYKLLHPGIQAEFHELAYNTDEWKYTNLDTGELYKVYTLN
ncbi:MAG: adenylate/guanylate cyclase domain-containing protein [Thermoproteota archaeon]|nr:adenylate/guanylate cyclase domain-containing protein [Thermoproteota archaeon]